MKKIKIVAIIPARMASSRFPGKPLTLINKLEMVEHVRRRAKLCKEFSDVVVATCDQEIFDVIKKYKGDVIMTSKKHIDCNERIEEASRYFQCSHIVNIQGDEILILPKDLKKICKEIKLHPNIDYWNAVAKVDNKNELNNYSIVKCFLSKQNNILFCARDLRSLLIEDKNFVYKLLGIQSFKKSGLLLYKKNNPSYLERIFSIGQLRIIENNMQLKANILSKGYIGIDHASEKKLVKNVLSTNNTQKSILKKII